MRWSIIRVIWLRELRDQLRDRRTVFMIVVLPLLIYPLAGLGMMQFAAGFLQKPSVVGVWGPEHLPPGPEPGEAAGLRPVAAWLSATSAGQLLPALALAEAAQARTDFPALVERGGAARFPARYFFPESEQNSVRLLFYEQEGERPPADEEEAAFLARARRPLDAREVDLLLVVP